MRAADTNVLVRQIVRDDPEQVSASDQFVSNGAWVSTVVLAETVWVLDRIYQRSASQQAETVEMLLNHTSFVLQDSDAVAAAVDLFRSRPSLGFSDCLILELARKAGHLPLGTFDRGLAKIKGAQKL
jgi:predicted nucleic-acid-binding protein